MIDCTTLSIEAQQALRRLYEGLVVHNPSEKIIWELIESGYITGHYIPGSYGYTDKARGLFNSWAESEAG